MTMNDRHQFNAVLIERADHLDGRDSWVVTIDGERFDYHKGTGLRTWKIPTQQRPGTVGWLEDWRRYTESAAPTLDEVLWSLACDASCFLEVDGIDDFAEQYADSEPVSEVLRCYQGCERAWRFLRRTYSEDQIAALAAEEEIDKSGRQEGGSDE